jgi:ferredoxin
MNKIVSFFMAVIFSVMGLFGIPYDAPDLEVKESSSVSLSEEQITLFNRVFETETAYLASMQLSNGALPMTSAKNGELRMNPYFADIAALALLDNAEKYAGNVVKYMDWHFAHLNTAEEDFNGLDGTIYDYVITVKDGKPVIDATQCNGCTLCVNICPFDAIVKED